MSDFIPWDQLARYGVISIDARETVEALCGRLETLGGHQQYNAPILIELAEGRVAPSAVPMLRELAQRQGARILDQSLESLLAELGPEPWAVTGQAAAGEASRRKGLPVIVLEGQDPVGLILPPGRLAKMVLSQPEFFDLFDERLSLQDFQDVPFVVVEEDAPVSEVAAAVAETGVPDRAYVLVERDGSWSVMDRRLHQDVPDMAALWSRSLQEIGVKFYPAEVRPFGELGLRQAQTIAQQTFLALTDDGVQIVGMMPPPPRRERQVLPAQDDFEVLDEPLSHFELDQSDLPQAEFVAATPRTRLAQVAWDIKELSEPQNAYVVVQHEDDSVGVISTWDLNQRLQNLEGDAWVLAVEEVVPRLAPVVSRAYDAVGYRQARILVRLRKYLVLTRNGRIEALLAQAPQQRIYRRAKSLDLYAVPRQVLKEHLPGGPAAMEEMAIEETLPAEDWSPTGPSPEPGPETESRFVNLWFRDREGRDVDARRPLVLEQTYRLRINIGQRREETLAPQDQPPIPEPVPESEEGTPLLISLFSGDFEIPEATRSILLPPEGDSEVVEFSAMPLRPTPGAEDRATINVYIYCHYNLVQAWQVKAEVVRPGQQGQGDISQEAILLETAGADPVDPVALGPLDHKTPRHLSLIVNKTQSGGYQFDVVVAPEEGADEVRLSCRIPLRREDLIHLITKSRRQLHNITRSRAYQKDVIAAAGTQQAAMRALALLGRQLYNRLFEMGEPGSAAQEVAKWIQEHVPEGSTFQVVDYAGDFVFPWSLIFDRIPWDEYGRFKRVEVEGFWGWRYEVELLTPELLEIYKAQGIEIGPAEPLRIEVGIHDRILWAQEQREFVEELKPRCGDLAEWQIADSGAELSGFLKAGTEHILYLFCHGFTERMASDIQIGDDLLGEFRAWLGSLPEEERTKLGEQEDMLFNVSDSWIRLTYGELPLTMMDYYTASNLRNAPLIFLNMCESAQILPSLSGGFIPFFIGRGARAILGTECPMTSTFAHAFAREFFPRFLSGQTLGRILLELRREFLEKGNPLGLAYTLYGDADIRLAKPIF